MVCENSDIRSLMERYVGAEFGSPLKCSLDIGSERYEGEATLSVSKELGRVVVSFESDDPLSWTGGTDTFIVELNGSSDWNIPVCVTSVNSVVIGDGISNLSGYVVPGRWFRRADDLVCTKFSFADMLPVLQQDAVSLGTWGWNVDLGKSSDLDGLGVTHSGVLWRSDKTSFSTEEAYQVLTSVTLAFSFASGNYRLPVLVEGMRNDSSTVTAMVGKFMVGKLHTNTKSQSNWFSVDGDVDVIGVATAIMDKYAKEGSHLRNVIAKYVESELAFRGGAYQAALVMAQSSLEALVKWEGKKRTVQIPSLLKGLGFQVTDSEIKSLTDFRNKIAHSDPLVDGFLQDVYRVWNEMQFWSEAWFLKKLGCSGRIKDRRKLWEEHFNLPEF